MKLFALLLWCNVDAWLLTTHRPCGKPTGTYRAARPMLHEYEGDALPPSFHGGKSPYDVLGIDYGASMQEVRTAYRKRAREFHPDTSSSPDADKFQELVEAFQAFGKIKPGSLESHPLWFKLSGLDRYWSREQGYDTADLLEMWLVLTNKIEDYVDENGHDLPDLDPSSLAALQLREWDMAAVQGAADEAESSAAGISKILAYRFFLGNEQWRVRWSVGDTEEAHEETWEVWGVLDTDQLRREAEQVRASASTSS